MESQPQNSKFRNNPEKPSYRAYPGSEFVVAKTLAKWKNLEPNEIDFSQGFNQK